jgi:hypothetical protein
LESSKYKASIAFCSTKLSSSSAAFRYFDSWICLMAYVPIPSIFERAALDSLKMASGLP